MQISVKLRLALLIFLPLVMMNSCRFVQTSEEYYGVEVNTSRNVFVIDISGSMEGKMEKDLKGNVVSEATNYAADAVGGAIGGSVGGMFSKTAKKEMTKLAEVKNQLIPVIKGLSDTTFFNIITFENVVELWKNSLVQANETNKNMAILKIENLESGGGTNLFGGLEKAFELAGPAASKESEVAPLVETIFFLTDGEPSSGKITNKTKILEEISKLNGAQKVIINVVGLGKDKDANFLSKIAAQNNGTYIDK